MLITDTCIKRPVFATVISLLLVAFGLISFKDLPLREYPDVSPPVVSVQTRYPGTSAEIIETQITQTLEDQISGIEGIRSISSESLDGQSNVTIEFTLSRDIDDAANDVRDRVSRALGNLPEEADPPEVFKVDSSGDVIVWYSFISSSMNTLELTDYADRYIVDRLSNLPGVARVRIGGEKRYAMRVWIDYLALAARNLTVADIESALRNENVELPAGRVESAEREFTVRVERNYKSPEDFRNLVLQTTTDGSFVRLGDVARIELGAENVRRGFRGNGQNIVGLGIVKQSTANTLAVAQAARAEIEKINPGLPGDAEISPSYDRSVFIQASIDEVYSTFFIAILLVVFVVYAFLGNIRSTLIPALAVPISVVSAFIVLNAFGYTINLLTLLALILAIGLVVDDAIVMLENIYRRIELGEPPLLAAYRGARQVGFAVIATTLALLAVFMPLLFLSGNTGRLFTEFAVAMSAAVAFSSVVALTLSPVLCSLIMKPKGENQENRFSLFVNKWVDKSGKVIDGLLRGMIDRPKTVVAVFLGLVTATILIGRLVPSEFIPQEDRGAIFVIASAPEGTSLESMTRKMKLVESKLMTYVDNGEANRSLIFYPSFSAGDNMSSGMGILILKPWDQRRPGETIVNELRGQLFGIPDLRAFAIMIQGLGGRLAKPLQVVIGGSSYEELAQWRDIILTKARENPGLLGIDSDYEETKPQLNLKVDTDRLADLEINLNDVGRSLETLLSQRAITTFLKEGEEYDVILEAEKDMKTSPDQLDHIFVRSNKTKELIALANVIQMSETSRAPSLNRYDRLRSITIESNLAPGYSLGEALTYIQNLIETELPETAKINFKGTSKEFTESQGDIYFAFLLAVAVIFLVLAAQFESFLDPMTIILTVPLAILGAVLGLLVTQGTMNLYSQIGVIMLIGLASKNGILIVEFANQLRDEGQSVKDAVLNATRIRLRPILMTAFSTAFGALPLILTSGAGSESRITIGVVIFFGTMVSTVLTMIVIPVAYTMLAPYSSASNAREKQIEKLEESLGYQQ